MLKLVPPPPSVAHSDPGFVFRLCLMSGDQTALQTDYVWMAWFCAHSLGYLQIALSAIIAVASGLAVTTHHEVHTHLQAGDNQDYSFLKYMKDEVCLLSR